MPTADEPPVGLEHAEGQPALHGQLLRKALAVPAEATRLGGPRHVVEQLHVADFVAARGAAVAHLQCDLEV